MLHRALGRLRLVGRRSLEKSFGGDSAGDPVPSVVPRQLPRTPVYDQSPVGSREPAIQAPKQLRDRFYDHMCDWQFHGQDEFEGWMPEHQWVKAVCDLVGSGWTFDKEGALLRLRRRSAGERVPSVVDLLSGVTLPSVIVESRSRSRVVDLGGTELTRPFIIGAGDEEEEKVESDDRMVIDLDGLLTLSVSEMVGETTAILARRGAGKTYLGGVIVEAYLQSSYDVPFMIVDPIGVWKGLLSTASGEPSEYEIALCGGDHGQFAIQPDGGRLMARIVQETHPLPFIFDLSNFKKEEQHEFCADLLAETFALNRVPRHVVIDEADLFAPQKLDGISRYQKRCLNQVSELIMRGRHRGLGGTLITLRPAVINKDILSQVLCMFILQTISPHDLDAIETWLHNQIKNDAKRQCRDNLPILPRGVAYFVRGGDDFRFGRFRVKEKVTFDSSYTPKMGEKPSIFKLSKLEGEYYSKISDLISVGISEENDEDDVGEDDNDEKVSGKEAGDSKTPVDNTSLRESEEDS